jgi:hypothetical protein
MFAAYCENGVEKEGIGEANLGDYLAEDVGNVGPIDGERGVGIGGVVVEELKVGGGKIDGAVNASFRNELEKGGKDDILLNELGAADNQVCRK